MTSCRFVLPIFNCGPLTRGRFKSRICHSSKVDGLATENNFKVVKMEKREEEGKFPTIQRDADLKMNRNNHPLERWQSYSPGTSALHSSVQLSLPEMKRINGNLKHHKNNETLEKIKITKSRLSDRSFQLVSDWRHSIEVRVMRWGEAGGLLIEYICTIQCREDRSSWLMAIFQRRCGSTAGKDWLESVSQSLNYEFPVRIGEFLKKNTFSNVRSATTCERRPTRIYYKCKYEQSADFRRRSGEWAAEEDDDWRWFVLQLKPLWFLEISFRYWEIRNWKIEWVLRMSKDVSEQDEMAITDGQLVIILSNREVLWKSGRIIRIYSRAIKSSLSFE